jgi:ribonucleoside-diphosphate reductase subunit M1
MVELLNRTPPFPHWVILVRLCFKITAMVTHNLNKIIDVNFYPLGTAKNSNIRHRLIGIGVQGLADAFILLGMPFESEEVFS